MMWDYRCCTVVDNSYVVNCANQSVCKSCDVKWSLLLFILSLMILFVGFVFIVINKSLIGSWSNFACWWQRWRKVECGFEWTCNGWDWYCRWYRWRSEAYLKVRNTTCCVGLWWICNQAVVLVALIWGYCWWCYYYM